MSASPWGPDYVGRFGDFRGALRRPVLTLHTIGDGIADVSNESAYRDGRGVVGKRGTWSRLT